MKELRQIAAKLLTDGAVKVVIGWEEGPRGARAAFVTRPEDAERLIFDARCVQNLATYLSPRRRHVVGLGKAAVVAKPCDAKAIAGLIRESQVKREDVVILGVRCGGVVREPTMPASLTAETVADRCGICETREPTLYDHLIGEPQPEPPRVTRREEQIAALMQKTPQERFAFWSQQLERCIRCHACREVCPMCFCEQCVADKTRPVWIESSSHPRANFAWQMTRVMHQAGRCVDCGECERACPVGIPLNLLTRYTAQSVEKRFGHKPSDDPSIAAPIGTFRSDDSQEFIR